MLRSLAGAATTGVAKAVGGRGAGRVPASAGTRWLPGSSSAGTTRWT